MTRKKNTATTLVHFAKVISTNFWNRIYFSRNVKGRLRVSETTLTEELVYQFFMMAAHKILPIKIFQTVNEKANGSDLEILLELNGGVVKLPCQAKIIYATTRYGALYHQVGNKYQIDILIQHAKRIGGYPIYMLYNYDGYVPKKLLKIAGGTEEYWGCSIGSAFEIRNKFFNRTKPPTFHEMHPDPCWPFYHLFESLFTDDNQLAKILNGFDSTNLKMYSIDDIMNDDGYNDLTSPEALGFVDHFESAAVTISKDSSLKEKAEFNPRFRILITNENLNKLEITMLS